MVNWYLGTMGFSYKDWNGVFYPAEMDSNNYLAHYGRVFNAVEIDSTFYGVPREEVVQRWFSVTSEGFQFCPKTPKVITHELGLVGASEIFTSFINTVRLLGHKLGPILIQLPPSFTVDQFADLRNFLAVLPGDLRFAVEFRHRSWYTADEKTARILAESGVCWAATHFPWVPARIYPTARFLYIRWIGRHGSFKHHDQERIDRSSELQDWWQLIQKSLDRVEAVFGFFNNDYAGHAPATLNKFKTIAGLPTGDIQPPQQASFL